MNENVTITEEYSLPSKGQIYAKLIDPSVELRSMTTAEEMKRLSISNTPYKKMSGIIEDCLMTKLGIPVYDLCIGDYQYLLHKLRVVTYGSDYKISLTCPYCGKQINHTVDMDSLELFEYDSSIKDKMTITLPKSKHVLELRFQTPRDLDRIETRREELKKTYPDMEGDPTIILTLISVVKSIDGDPINPFTAEEFFKKLPMRDTNYILKRASEIQDSIGVNTSLTIKCDGCGREIVTPFRLTSEFFRPEDD